MFLVWMITRPAYKDLVLGHFRLKTPRNGALHDRTIDRNSGRAVATRHSDTRKVGWKIGCL